MPSKVPAKPKRSLTAKSSPAKPPVSPAPAAGERLIPDLARSLDDEFGNGVSVANHMNFRQFYQSFPKGLKSYALRSLMTWSHYRLVMRVDDPAHLGTLSHAR